jgi:hypothetical protein
MTVPGPKKQNPVNKKERAGGMPTYVPTVKERKIVEKAAGFGLPHDKICQLIVSERTGKPIDPKTLREVFRVELERQNGKRERAHCHMKTRLGAK